MEGFRKPCNPDAIGPLPVRLLSICSATASAAKLAPLSNGTAPGAIRINPLLKSQEPKVSVALSKLIFQIANCKAEAAVRKVPPV